MNYEMFNVTSYCYYYYYYYYYYGRTVAQLVAELRHKTGGFVFHYR
jgi:hypothetical protein